MLSPTALAYALAALVALLSVAATGAEARRLPARINPEADTVSPGHATRPYSGRGEGLDPLRNLRVNPTSGNGTDLDRYMALANPDYAWNYSGYSFEGHIPLLGGYTLYSLNLTSQRWLTEAEAPGCSLWQHALAIVVPHGFDPDIDTAMIWATQGDDPPRVPTASDLDIVLVKTMAVATRSIVISLFQTPNQVCRFPNDPTQANRSEDSLLAWTWFQ